MPSLSLALFGSFNALADDQPEEIFRSIKNLALLIYLAVERDHPHRRASLSPLLWPDMPALCAPQPVADALLAGPDVS